MQKIILILTNFAKGQEDIEPIGNSQNQIRYDVIFKKLKRVWNDGNGLISFAEMDGDTLLINKLFCSAKEISTIEKNLTVKYEFVELGYPDYYFKGLKDKRVKA